MIVSDHWVEFLSCPLCHRSGPAVLAHPEGSSWEVQVISLPKDFKVVTSEYGINFYCSSCGIPVEP